MSALTSSTTFIHRIPDELLREIFLLADTDDAQSQDRLKKLGANIGWIVSRVCQRWEDLASVARLKKFVHLDLGYFSILPKDGLLSVTLDAMDKDLIPSGGKRLPSTIVLAIVMADTDQWKSLTIAAKPSVMDLFLRPIHGNLNNLQTLELKTKDEHSPADVACLANIMSLSNLPRLHTLVGSPAVLVSLPLPSESNVRNLRTLYEPECSISEVRTVLSRMPQLETLSLFYSERFDYSEDSEDDDDVSDEEEEDFDDEQEEEDEERNRNGRIDGAKNTLKRVVLHHLTSLSASFYAYSVLRILTLPALTSCEFNTGATKDRRLDQVDDIFKNKYFSQLLFRSSAKSGGLRSLRLGVNCDADQIEIDYVRVLQRLLSLQHLQLEREFVELDFDNVETLFNHVIASRSDHFLPNLRTLDIDVKGTHLSDDELEPYAEVLRQLQRSRASVNYRLLQNGEEVQGTTVEGGE